MLNNCSRQGLAKLFKTICSYLNNKTIILTLKCFLYYSSAKIMILNKEGIIEKNSYERRDYESVDEKSLS